MAEHKCEVPTTNLMAGRSWECSECYAHWRCMRAKFTEMSTELKKMVGANALVWRKN